MISRRFFLKVATATTLGLASGCVTRNVLNDGKNYYRENVSTLLITSDGSRVAFIGDKYHYIFDAPRFLVAILKDNVRAMVTPQFGDFSVADDNRITGLVLLRASPTTEEQKTSLVEFGFPEPGLTRDVELRGTRYLANAHTTGVPVKLSKPYSVSISESKGFLAHGLNVAATPITATADGALILFGLPLLLLACSGVNACN